MRTEDKKYSNIGYFVATIVLSVLVVLSCSTDKKGFFNEKYHNVTAHYNVWWNGNESLKDAIATLDKKTIDDYTQILPMYKLGTKEDAMSVYAQLDRAIEKGVAGIQKHSISIHGKEYIEYVKKCYLMMAYANFYKKDYATASSTCRMIMSMYSGTQLADEATILYARCLTMTQEYAEAEMILDQLDADVASGKASEKIAPLLYPALVEVTLPQTKYKKAIDNLRLSIDNTKNRTFKARQYFIMAQIYHKLDKKTTAMKYYQKCLKMHPAYVMEFNAKINIASCYDIKNGDYSKILKTLDKMLKERKNEDYQDQIYYAKGDMYLGAKELRKACDNFQKSVEVSKNAPQKIKSSIKLGNVMYDEYKNYDEAQKYYDTAVRLMPKSYPFGEKIRARHEVLTSLVANTRVINRVDSLFRMADMDSLAREKYIKKLIAEAKKKEQERIEAELLAAFKENSKSESKSLKGDWYFYNASTTQKGKENFLKNWGARALEDFWFLSKKNTVSFDNPSQNTNDTTKSDIKTNSMASFSSTKLANEKFTREYYLKDLPKTQEQRDSMSKDVARCLLNAGFIYNDGVKNSEKAVECFLRLAKEFPETDYVLPAFYQLYKVYEKQGNTPNANYYKNMILRGFPDSDYANLIQDEDYYLEIAKRQKLSEKEYSEIYKMYNKKRFGEVIARASSAISLYKDEKMTPKFKFWQALAYVKTNQVPAAITLMENIVTTHPTSEIVPTVKEQLVLLKSGKLGKTEEPQVVSAQTIDQKKQQKKQVDTTANKKVAPQKAEEEEELPPESQMYRYRDDIQHYVIFILDDKKIKALEMQYTIADFNMANYSIKNLRANALLFTNTQQMITVNRFSNASEAMDYWRFITKEGGCLQQFDKSAYKSFVISIQNYQTFYNQKNIEAYLKFYKKYYIDNK